jgi:hypothetical protein
MCGSILKLVQHGIFTYPVWIDDTVHSGIIGSGKQEIQAVIRSKIEDFGFSRHFDQVRAAVQSHVVEEFGFIEFPASCTRGTDTHRYFVFDKIRQIIIGAVPRERFNGEVSFLVCPHRSPVNEKEIDPMSFRMGNSCHLKAPGCRFVIVFAQNKQEIGHFFLLG